MRVFMLTASLLFAVGCALGQDPNREPDGSAEFRRDHERCRDEGTDTLPLDCAGGELCVAPVPDYAAYVACMDNRGWQVGPADYE